MNEDGEFATDARGMYIPCPSVPEVQQYFKDLCTRFIREWDFDGHKLDAYYTVPNCYNPAHNHKNPMESHQDFPKIIEIIQETTKSIKPYGITEICNCGVPQDIWQLAYVDQPVTSDPVGSGQVRQRVKMFKALMGANAPAYADHVELTAGEMAEGIYIHDGRDFASAVGTGAVIGTKFTWPADPDVDKNPFLLTREKEAHWKKWIDLYMEQMLSKKEYLNLYDIAFDVPETHVIQDRDTLFYAFYAENWQGKVELRGLSDQKYIVVDYVNNMVLGHINGNAPTLDIAFSDYLLIKASPLSHKQFHLRLRNHH